MLTVFLLITEHEALGLCDVCAVHAGFDVADAIALLRLDDLYVEVFEVKDVKVADGSSCLSSPAGSCHPMSSASLPVVAIADIERGASVQMYRSACWQGNALMVQLFFPVMCSTNLHMCRPAEVTTSLQQQIPICTSTVS